MQEGYFDSLNNENASTSPSIFGLLNRIYSSTLLTNRLKHYYACRVLCLGYRAVSASILLYDGGEEKLVSKGTYLHRHGIKLHSDKKKLLGGPDGREILEKQHIVTYLGFYHYLFSKFISTGIPPEVSENQAYELAEFFKEKKYLSYDFPKKVELLGDETKFRIISTGNKSDVIEFVKFCIDNSRKHATRKNGMLDLSSGTKYYYQLNKELITKEKYEIGTDVDTYSGRIYHNLTVKGAIRDSDNLIIESEGDFGKAGKPSKPVTLHNFKKKLANVSLEFRSKVQYYVGVPLIANGRCIGILRLFFAIDGKIPQRQKAGLLYCSDGEEVKKFLKQRDNERSLLYAVEILGNLLDQTYPQSFMEGIPRDSDFMKYLGNANKDTPFNDWCTNVQKAINCHGSMLRFKESALSGPARKGYSKSIETFVDYIQEHPELIFIIKDGKFHHALTSIFPDVNIEFKNKAINVIHKAKIQNSLQINEENNKRIVAVLIDFGKSYSDKDTKVLKYYYCIGNQEVVRSINSIVELGTTNFSELNLIDKSNPEESLIPPVYHKLFTGSDDTDAAKENIATHKGRYLLLIDIPSVEVAGIASFSNSSNRRFSLSDVRFAYGQVKRLGLSISQMNSTSLKVAISNSLHSMKRVKVQLAELIQVCKKNKVPLNEIDKFKITLKRYSRRINLLEKYYDSGSFFKKLSKSRKSEYDLINYLKNKISEEYGTEAKSKGICIDIHENSSIIKTKLNQECAWLSLEGILENALERTQSADVMSNIKSDFHVSGFKKNTKNVPGNIKVEFNYLNDDLEISITNYGSSLTKKEAEYISHWNYSPADKKGNRGFGLHLVRTFLLMINSEWLTPVSQKKVTTFKILIKT